jgi:hypothetical protein
VWSWLLVRHATVIVSSRSLPALAYRADVEAAWGKNAIRMSCMHEEAYFSSILGVAQIPVARFLHHGAITAPPASLDPLRCLWCCGAVVLWCCLATTSTLTPRPRVVATVGIVMSQISILQRSALRRRPPPLPQECSMWRQQTSCSSAWTISRPWNGRVCRPRRSVFSFKLRDGLLSIAPEVLMASLIDPRCHACSDELRDGDLAPLGVVPSSALPPPPFEWCRSCCDHP